MTSRTHQAPHPSGASGTIPNASRETHREKSPERGRAEAPVYRRLAQFVGEAGFPEVSAARIHDWTSAGLVPPTPVRRSAGDSGFSADLREEVLPQLLALAAYRRLTARRSSLIVLLWADGWTVPADLVKAALLSAVPARTLSGESERVLDRLAGIASWATPRLVRALRPGRMRDGQAEDAAVALLPAMHGALEPDETAGTNLERLGGLHRARTDAPPGVRPWLKGSAARAWVFMVRFAPPTKVRQYISALGPAELDRSRAHARFVIYELPAFARLVETRFGRGFAGFRLVAEFGPHNAEGLAAAAVVLRRFRPLAHRFDLLIAGHEPYRERRDVLLAIGAEYERQHPEQRRTLQKQGLDGLLERGELKPLDGVDALLARAERLAADG